MDSFSPILVIAAGLVLLLTGRKIFWLAAALTAFLFTYRLLQNFIGPGLAGILIAGVVGLVFVWLAISFVKTVGLVIGALAGAATLPYLLGLFGIDWPWWILALVGAVIGIIVVAMAFDLGLVLMTTWIGANAVTSGSAQLFSLSDAVAGVLLLVLLAVGVAVQLSLVRPGRTRRRVSAG